MMLNQHAANYAQRYALDIAQLNSMGSRARGLLPADISSYRIYGAEIVAPCSGEVLEVVDGLPDRFISDPDLSNAGGNRILLHCDGSTVVLAHLAPGSISAAPGEHVTAGQTLARVGNSGATIEPHLHIHAVRGRHSSEAAFDTAAGVPMRFDGRYLIKNDVVRLGKTSDIIASGMKVAP